MILGAAIGIGSGVLIVLLVVLVVRTWILTDAIRESQKSNVTNITTTAQAVKNTEAILKLVQSCVTPGQECKTRGDEQTAGAVFSINDYALFAAACADEPGTQGVKEIEACIRANLASKKPTE